MNARTVIRFTARPARRLVPRLVPGVSLAAIVALGACSGDGPTESRAADMPPLVETGEVQAVAVAENLEHPWGMTFLPDGRILVTERPGRLRVIENGVLRSGSISGVPGVHNEGQGGLLDVAIHPDFETNGYVYLSYAKSGSRGATTAVSRGVLDGYALRDVEEIFEADAWTREGVHFGSRLVFDNDGYLYVTVGDRGQMQEAQDPSNHQGTINRLNDDGSVPADNPFVGQSGYQPSIWAYGIRSPQGLTIHPVTGELLESEHGPRGGDEFNHIQSGRNYGWPAITYGINYNGSTITDQTSAPGMEQPLHYWVPSIATSGLAIYSGDRYPGWEGSAFIGGLAGTTLARLTLDGLRVTEEERLLDDWGQRIRDVRNGPDGYLYILTDVASGGLYRLEPAS